MFKSRGQKDLTDGTSEDLVVESTESIEILTTDDVKIKTIGEVFANDTSRQIFVKLFEGITSPSEISNKTGISLPLVLYHLKRLEQVGLIKVGHVELSSKLQKVKHYIPAKLVIMFIPSASVSESYTISIENIIAKLRKKALLPLLFCVSPILTYIVMKIQSAGYQKFVVGTSANPDLITLLVTNLDLMFALGIAGLTTFIGWKFKRRF